uniref:BZIP domain-containing protein n=1 Tax=Globisporangium ultimum (strain ATCC 200006 / CBS 805.95 / DAOM BR144) TaxID=431595 RepID=K3W8M4_GLOUD
MTDFLRSILQNASPAATPTPAASFPAVKSEMRPVDQIQVPPAACVVGADAAAAALMEKQRMIKVEMPDPAITPSGAAAVDAGKAQRAARRDVVNARRETKRKTMSTSSPSPEATSAVSSPSSLSVEDATVDVPIATATVTTEKSKKMKTGKTTSVNVVSTAEPVILDAKPAKKAAASALSMSASMLFNSEIDALGEERLRAMEAQLESLDPDSKEAKKKRRLIRNRMSAQLHRERKKAYVGQLEDQLMEKERELQLLQEKLNAMESASQLLKQKMDQVDAAAAPATPKAKEDEVVIKTEPIVDVSSAFEAPTTAAASAPATVVSRDNWDDYCFQNLEDTEMADVAADDLLRDFDHPFSSAYAAIEQQNEHEHPQQHHEIHAAKKNLVMMMGVMFSATFFGNSPFFFDVQNGSNFSSMFNANPPKEFSQLNIASKIMSSLEKSSWKDFRDIASWTASSDDVADVAETEVEPAAAKAAASPSAASDITDSSGTCDSPAQIDDCLSLGFETDLIDEFVYPVDDPFAPALADTNWFGDDADDFGQSDVDDNDDDSKDDELFLPEVTLAAKNETTSKKEEQLASQSMTSRLFDKLTTLWHEKNQVLLTVLDGKNEVTRRSVADMSSIRKSMENGSIFSKPPSSSGAKTSPLANDQSVSFLYPLSAFSLAEKEERASSTSDVMFLEVSCQMNALSM